MTDSRNTPAGAAWPPEAGRGGADGVRAFRPRRFAQPAGGFRLVVRAARFDLPDLLAATRRAA